jgi:pyruvate/2-oxoglutarate dehydrogenase complex dihydrolipoamide dehydrogenase (E3) component
VSATVTLEPWGSGDLPLLERLMGDPRMTEHLGGPESPEKSKNIIRSAKVRSFTLRAAEFGVELESAVTRMEGVQATKRAMVDGLRALTLERDRASGAELIMGEARFVGERAVEVELADGGRHRIGGERVFLNLGTHATIPDLPGLAAARPMTHVELLDPSACRSI